VQHNIKTFCIWIYKVIFCHLNTFYSSLSSVSY
jgi:hypothetical protein